MRKKSNVCFGSPLQIVTIFNFPSGASTFECTGVTLTDSWKGRLYARNRLSLLRFLVSTWMKRVQIMASIDVSVKHCSFWDICNICRVPSARAVGRVWTGNSWTGSPINRFYASLATRMFPLPWIKTMCFSAFWQSLDCWKCCTHRSFYWSSVNRWQPTIFIIHSDHFRLHFYNIRQCQLTIKNHHQSALVVGHIPPNQIGLPWLHICVLCSALDGLQLNINIT